MQSGGKEYVADNDSEQSSLFDKITENYKLFEGCSILILAIVAFAYSVWILIDYFTAVDGINGPNLFVQTLATYSLIVACFTYLDWRSENS